MKIHSFSSKGLLPFVFMIPCLMANAQWPGFATRNLYTSQNGSSSVIVQDLNNDGIPDVATANSQFSSVSVFFGNGNGTVQGAMNVSTINTPLNVTTGFFNDDEWPDLATANGDNGVSILLGTGLGSFSDFEVISVANRPQDIVSEDFNGDGYDDLATANINGTDISVLLSNGDGSFGTAVDYSTSSGPRRIRAALINSDEHLDLVTANENSNNITVRFGDGTGAFPTSSSFSMGTRPWGLAVADLNNDGAIDVATSNITSDNVTVRLGNGDGTFQSIQTTGLNSTNITFADFDGDGFNDLVGTNLDVFGTVTFFPGDGDGTFGSGQNYLTNQGPSDVAAADLDGDGVVDLAVANSSSGGRMATLVNLGESILEISPSVIDFGNVEFGTSATLELSSMLTNSGTGNLELPTTLSDDANGAFTLTDVPADFISILTTDSLTISFNPVALGAYNGEVSIASNSTSGTVLIPITGSLVDSIPPDSEIIFVAAELASPSDILVFETTSTDNLGGSGVATLELYYRFEGGPWQLSSSAAGPFLTFDTAAASGEGTYDFYTIATDTGGASEAAPATADISVEAVDISSVLEWRVLD